MPLYDQDHNETYNSIAPQILPSYWVYYEKTLQLNLEFFEYGCEFRSTYFFDFLKFRVSPRLISFIRIVKNRIVAELATGTVDSL